MGSSRLKLVRLATGVFTVLGASVASSPAAASVGARSSLRPGILYKQTDNGSSYWVLSTRWISQGRKSSSMAADDFVVPEGETWIVSGLDAHGMYAFGEFSSQSENVRFFRDAGGLPGELIAKYVLHGEGESFGDFQENLPLPGLTLEAGHYWMSIQSNMDRPQQDQWYWQTRVVQSNSPAAWVNPGGARNPDCTQWTELNQCLLGAGPDMIFDIRGVVP